MKAARKVSPLSIFLVVFFPVAARAQNSQPQGQASVLLCRPFSRPGYYKNASTYVEPGETVIGDQICHVEAVKAAPAADPAIAAAPPAPVAPAPPVVPVPTPAPTPAVAQPIVAPAPAPVVVAAPKPEPHADHKKRIFVTDEPLSESTYIAKGGNTSSASGSSGGTAAGFSQSGGNPRTVEIDTLLYKTCSTTVVTNDPAKADFILLFRRDDGRRSSMFAYGGFYGLALSANSKINGSALFNASTGDLVFATEARTVKNAIKDVCTQIQ